MEKYYKKSCEEFTRLTLSKDPVPGGGSVAALAGALGISLAGMVAALTEGKKKYAQYQEDMQRILAETEALRQEFLSVMDEDMENFLPLSRAYGLPKETAEEKAFREEELERCLMLAARAPLHLVEACSRCLPLYEELLLKGSKIALSDVGCGVSMIRAASDSAWLNVLININMMRDTARAEEIRRAGEQTVRETAARCTRIWEETAARLG